MLKNLSFLLILFLSSFCVFAQVSEDKAIVLKTCNISVEAANFTATTTLNMEFYNPNLKVMDGQFNFGLSQGQVISAFALDINGKFRDGVMIDKKKGRVAYENTIRRRVDPGLLEMTEGDQYRIRIYPMPANGTRKVRIVISQVMLIAENALQYHLPLIITTPIESYFADIKISGVEAVPSVNNGILTGQRFTRQKDLYSLQVSKKNSTVSQALSFKIPLENDRTIANFSQGSYDLMAVHLKLPVKNFQETKTGSAAIFWDISASAAKRNISKELLFLEKYIAQKKIERITIVCFSNTLHDTREFRTTTFANISRYLQGQKFDGGTQLGAIDASKYNADANLLFSDGLNSFGSGQIRTGSKTMTTVNSSSIANHTLLSALAAQTGGIYVDLNVTEPATALQKIMQAPLQLISVTQSGKPLQTSLSLPFQTFGWLSICTVIKDHQGEIIFNFGREGKILFSEKIDPAFGARLDSQLNEMYLLQQFASLQKTGQDDFQKNSFAMQNEFVSSKTSFIVLDELNDYIEYGIMPPADLQQAYSEKLNVVRQKAADLQAAQEKEELSNLRKAAALYNARIKWWGAGARQIDVDNLIIQLKPMYVEGTREGPGKPAATQPTDNINNIFKGANTLDEVVVMGYGTRQKMSLTGSVARVSNSELFSMGAATVTQALQGRVAGVQVVPANSPGSADKIFIRGNTSIKGGEPLYVLDGVPGDALMMSTLTPNDIKSITVLKDAQATALYGSRAYFGAIIIETKTLNGNRRQATGTVKYKNQEDVEYVSALKTFTRDVMYAEYLRMLKDHEYETAFYADAAQVLFEAGDKENALRVLSNLGEADLENHQLLRGMGYILESWGMYAEAIGVYKKVLAIKDEEPQSYRDLALAYDRNGQHAEAVELLYKVITKNFYQYEDRYRGIKSLLLNEMNGIVNRYNDLQCTEQINKAVMVPLPVDVRVVIDWNKDETDIDLHITDPEGEECFYSHKETKAGGRLSEDFTQGNGPEEFEIKNAQKGRYSISVNYYGDRYQKQQVSPFVKLTIYKNFGRPNQTMSVEVFSLLNQNGKVEIGNIKW